MMVNRISLRTVGLLLIIWAVQVPAKASWIGRDVNSAVWLPTVAMDDLINRDEVTISAWSTVPQFTFINVYDPINASWSIALPSTSPNLSHWYYRRVGDSFEIDYAYEHTNNVSTLAGHGTYVFGLPGDIDTSKISVSKNYELASQVGIGATHDKTCQVLAFDSHYGVALICGGYVGSGYEAITNSTVAYRISATIPIVGLSTK